MKIQLSESGVSKEFKPLEELDLNVAILPNSPFGKNYYCLGFNNTSKISNLLSKFDETKELELYFFEDILYITIESEPVYYTLRMHDEDLLDFCTQIKKDNKILIASYNTKEKIENIFGYDIIS